MEKKHSKTSNAEWGKAVRLEKKEKTPLIQLSLLSFFEQALSEISLSSTLSFSSDEIGYWKWETDPSEKLTSINKEALNMALKRGLEEFENLLSVLQYASKSNGRIERANHPQALIKSTRLQIMKNFLEKLESTQKETEVEYLLNVILLLAENIELSFHGDPLPDEPIELPHFSSLQAEIRHNILIGKEFPDPRVQQDEIHHPESTMNWLPGILSPQDLSQLPKTLKKALAS